jgi:hypothetical protein
MITANNIHAIYTPVFVNEKSKLTLSYKIDKGYIPISSVICQLSEIHILNLIIKIVSILISSNEYLLIPENIILNPDLVFIDPNNEESVKIIYLPVKNKKDYTIFELLQSFMISIIEKRMMRNDYHFIAIFQIINNHNNLTNIRNELLVIKEGLIKHDNNRGLKWFSDNIFKKIVDLFRNKSSNTLDKSDLEKLDVPFPTTILESSHQTSLMAYELVHVNNENSSISLKEGCIKIGRDHMKSDTVIDCEGISRIHLEINLCHGIIQIRDLKSLNGTYINNQKITPDTWYVLTEKDTLKIAQEEYKISNKPVLLSQYKVSYN